MTNAAEAPVAAPRPIDEFVVHASATVGEAANAVAQKLPVYTNQQVQTREVQEELKNAFLDQVPGWRELVSEIEAGFDSRGVVLVRGVRFDPENRVSIGLHSALGRPSGYGNWNWHVSYDLRPIQRPPEAPDFEQYFHTGSQLHVRPHEILTLECVQQGNAGGGVSQLVALGPILANMRSAGQEKAIETLKGRLFPFKRPKFLVEGIFGYRILEPWADGPDGLMIRFQREPIFDGAQELPLTMDDEMRAAIAAFEAAMRMPGTYVEYQLQSGELVIIDNRHVLHARTAVVGGPESGRHLKRIKVYRP